MPKGAVDEDSELSSQPRQVRPTWDASWVEAPASNPVGPQCTTERQLRSRVPCLYSGHKGASLFRRQRVSDPSKLIDVTHARKRALSQHLARLQMRPNLALDPLQGVVDRLRVALELLGGGLVGVAVEVEGEDAAL